MKRECPIPEDQRAIMAMERALSGIPNKKHWDVANPTKLTELAPCGLYYLAQHPFCPAVCGMDELER